MQKAVELKVTSKERHCIVNCGLVGLVGSKSHACYLLKGAGSTRFESHCGEISVAVPMAHLAMLNL